MPKISKFFRVAVEGATADGRTIERQQLVEMAATYNRDTYAARVNMEHIRGVTAEPPFQALGDVIALRTEEIELQVGGKAVRKLALFAQIEPTDNLVKINAAKQKLYSSVEINPNFAASGKAYLTGLAVTDSPASLGTEMLTFVAGQRAKGTDPYAARRSSPETLFVEALETAIEFDDVDASPTQSEAQGFFAAGAAFFKQLMGQQAPQPQTDPVTPPVVPPVTPPADPANDNVAAKFTAIASGMEKIVQGVTAMQTDFASQIGTLRTDIATVKASIDTTEERGQPRRSPATGGTGALKTDC